MADILVVEDKESLRTMLRKTLEARGYTVTEAADAYEARRCLQGARVLVVLTDLRLPAGSGFDVLQAAREQDAQVPVIVMTAFGTVDEGGARDEGRRRRLPHQARWTPTTCSCCSTRAMGTPPPAHGVRAPEERSTSGGWACRGSSGRTRS